MLFHWQRSFGSCSGFVAHSGSNLLRNGNDRSCHWYIAFSELQSFNHKHNQSLSRTLSYNRDQRLSLHEKDAVISCEKVSLRKRIALVTRRGKWQAHFSLYSHPKTGQQEWPSRKERPDKQTLGQMTVIFVLNAFCKNWQNFLTFLNVLICHLNFTGDT